MTDEVTLEDMAKADQEQAVIVAPPWREDQEEQENKLKYLAEVWLQPDGQRMEVYLDEVDCGAIADYMAEVDATDSELYPHVVVADCTLDDAVDELIDGHWGRESINDEFHLNGTMERWAVTLESCARKLRAAEARRKAAFPAPD